MKPLAAAVLALAMGMGGCMSIPPPAQHKFGAAHWKKQKGWPSIGDSKYDLVCDANGKIIATIMGDAGDETFTAYGGDGAAHGTFSTLPQTKARAEMLQGESYQNEYWPGWLNNQCP